MSKKEKSTLFTFGSIGTASFGGLLFLLAFGLPYWVDYKDYDVSVNGVNVNLRYTYGFWRYCNKQQSVNGTAEVCASVDEHSDVEQATICLILVTILLYVSTLVNSALYLSLFKKEILCLYISLISIVAAGITSLVAVINFELADHSITVNNDTELSFRISNLSASFWLAAVGCVDAVVTAVVVIIAISAYLDESRTEDEQSIISTSSSRVSIDKINVDENETSPELQQLNLDHSNASIEDDVSDHEDDISYIEDDVSDNEDDISVIDDDISDIEDDRGLSSLSSNTDDSSDHSQYLSSSYDSSSGDSDDGQFDSPFAKLNSDNGQFDSPFAKLKFRNLQVEKRRPESSKTPSRVQPVLHRRSQSVPYLPPVEQIPKVDFTDDQVRVRNEKILQSVFHDGDLEANHPPPSTFISDIGSVRSIDPNTRQFIDKIKTLKRAHEETLVSETREELPEQDYVSIEDMVIDVDKKKRTRPKFLRKRNAAKRKRIQKRRQENKIIKDAYTTTTTIPIYPPVLGSSKPAPWTISETKKKKKRKKKNKNEGPQMPASMKRALIALGLYSGN